MNLRDTYFNFKGRIGRRTFWLYYVLPVFALSALLQTSAEYYENQMVDVALFVINIVLMVAMLAGFVKRLHDRDKSAWWLILVFVPVIGTIYWIVDLGLFKGVDKSNEYGSPAVLEDKSVIDA